MTESEDKNPLQEAISAYRVPAPPPELGARVAREIFDAAGPSVSPRAPGPWRRVIASTALLAGAAALAFGGLMIYRLTNDSVAAGERAPATRETATLGKRATLVIEPAARVRWRSEAGGSLKVEQHRGDVFYRVDAGPFVVQTPHGTVRVKGTCFRVEVPDMKIHRQALVGAGLGAAVATGVVVTVYEGRVSLANSLGTLEVSAGQRAALSPGQVPRLVPPTGPFAFEDPAGASVPDHPSALRVPDDLAALRARVAAQEKELARLREVHTVDSERGDRRKALFDTSPEELLARAKRCEISYDYPPFDGEGGSKVPSSEVKKYQLSDTEREAIEEVLAQVQKDMSGELRKLYIEMSGDATTAGHLSGSTLLEEVIKKAPGNSAAEARTRLARERAGLVARPSDLGATPVVERALRFMMQIGDDVEGRLGERIGRDRARGLRVGRNGWGNTSSWSGCPGE